MVFTALGESAGDAVSIRNSPGRLFRFPPFPAPIAFVCRSILWHKHSEMWGFGSCDKHSKVKAEFAAYEPELEVASSPATEKVTPILDSGVPVAQTTPIMSA